MRKPSAFATLQRQLDELRRANGANVAITFALALLPLAGFVGAAIDYTHANAVKAAMQMAADSTALMLSKSAPGLKSGQLQKTAGDYFNAMFTRGDTKGVKVDATFTQGYGGQLIVTAEGKVKTSFLGLLGFKNLHVGVNSQVKWGNTRARIALVLDNTGSMASAGKMSALISATNSLLDQIQATTTQNGDVYVSIIPFVKDVNVGASNYNQSWIDWTDWDAKNGTCTGYSGWKSPNDKASCTADSGTWTAANHNTWNGCVTDRGLSTGPSTKNTDTNVTSPGGAADTKFPAEQYSSCPQAVLPLTYDWAAMKTMVNNMTPNGNTNQGIGLAHGWMSLVGGGPYPAPPSLDSNYVYNKVIILLTDGLNTQNRWYSTQSQIDSRQQVTCDSVKAAGVIVYTVQVNTDGAPTSTLLQNCASSPDKFFLLTSAGQIMTTFQKIGADLGHLRIAQ